MHPGGDIPPIKYADNDGVHIAYQSFGSGPEVVCVPPFVQNIERLWGDTSGRYPEFLRKLSRLGRITHFDKRGTGLSDRADGIAAVENRMNDMIAVMDAASIERATFVSVSEGGPIAMLFAATYPERVESLVLFGSTARLSAAPGYDAGIPLTTHDEVFEKLVARWGTRDSILPVLWLPELLDDEVFMSWLPSYERSCASPGDLKKLSKYIAEIDVREVMPAISAPTLVMHRDGDRVIPVAQGRYVAEHIPNARYIEYSGDNHTPWLGDSDQVLADVESFVTGRTGTTRVADRFLATVLFTDIVGSTEMATRLGDNEWRTVLDRHDAVIESAVTRFGGVVVKTTGDGVLATFDSPSRAVAAARDISVAAGVPVRAGAHTGEVERRGDDIAGVAVHVAARVAAMAAADELLTTTTVRDLALGSAFEFSPAGRHGLKGVAGEWELCRVEPSSARQ